MLHKLRFFFAYLQKPAWDTGISPPELREFIATHPAGKAIDLGCGTGTNVITLAQNGWKVIGIDFAWRAIQIAKKKAKKSGVDVDLRRLDATRLDSVVGQFDLVLDIGCYTSLPGSKKRDYVHKIDQLLAETGTLLVYLFYKVNPTDSRPGVTDADVRLIIDRFQLVERREGAERGIRPSAWLTFKKRDKKVAADN